MVYPLNRLVQSFQEPLFPVTWLLLWPAVLGPCVQEKEAEHLFWFGSDDRLEAHLESSPLLVGCVDTAARGGSVDLGKSMFKCLDQALCCSIGGRMVGCTSEVGYAPLPTPGLKFL